MEFNDNIMDGINIFIWYVFILHRDYIFNLLNYVFFLSYSIKLIHPKLYLYLYHF